MLDARISREEIFGPVLVIIPFKTEEEAIALANDSEYGLAAAVHSSDANQIARVSEKLEAGTGELLGGLGIKVGLKTESTFLGQTVWINQYTYTSKYVLSHSLASTLLY